MDHHAGLSLEVGEAAVRGQAGWVRARVSLSRLLPLPPRGSLLQGALLLGVALGCGGCLYSVNPFFGEKDYVFDGSLVGVWQNDDEARVVIRPDPDSLGYDLVMLQKLGSEAGHYQARLARIEGRTFIDISPADHYPTTGLDALHQVYRIHLKSNALEITAANPSEMNHLIETSRADTTLNFRGILVNSADDEDKADYEELLMVSPVGAMTRFLATCANGKEYWDEKNVATYRRLR